MLGPWNQGMDVVPEEFTPSSPTYDPSSSPTYDPSATYSSAQRVNSSNSTPRDHQDHSWERPTPVKRRSSSADHYERPRNSAGAVIGGSVGVPGSSNIRTSGGLPGRLGSSLVLLGEDRARSSSSGNRTKTFAGLSTPQTNLSRRREPSKSSGDRKSASPVDGEGQRKVNRNSRGTLELLKRRNSEPDVSEQQREPSPSSPVVKSVLSGPASPGPLTGLKGTLASIAGETLEPRSPNKVVTRQPRSRARSGSPLGEPRSSPPSRSRTDTDSGAAIMGLRPAPRMRSTSPAYLMDRMDKTFLMDRTSSQVRSSSRSPSETTQKRSGTTTPTGSVASFSVRSGMPDGPLTSSMANSGGYLRIDVLRAMQDAAQERLVTQSESATSAPRQESTRDISVYQLLVLFLGWTFCLISWLLGVCSPSASLDFLPGTEWDWHMTKSLAQTLTKLYEEQVIFGFIALGFFSIVVPVMKISCTFMLIYKMASTPVHVVFGAHRTLIKWLSYLASYQFVDLYCGILFVCLFNGDASDARFEVGFYWFFSYSVTSLATSEVLDHTFEMYEPPAQADKDEQLSLHGPVSSATSSLQLQAQLYEPIVHNSDVEAGLDAYKAGLRQVQNSDKEDLTEVLEVSGEAAAGAERCGVESSMREVTPKNSGVLDLLQDSGGPLRRLSEWSIRIFSGCFLLCVLLTFWGDMLEVRTLVHQVAVDRQTLSLKSMLIDFLPAMANPVVVVFMWLALAGFPFAYTAAILVISEAQRRERSQVQLQQWEQFAVRAAQPVPNMLRQWAMADVMLVAAMIFLFMIQDKHTLTMPPDGSYAFYIFIGAGLAFFYLRWFVDVEAKVLAGNGKATDGNGSAAGKVLQGQSCIAALSYVVLLGVWIITWSLIAHGVPGAAPHFSYKTLAAVCTHTRPFMTKAVRQMPASFGNCKDVSSHPPQPCMGGENLHTEEDDDGYMNAIWISGLRTTNIEQCLLTKGQAKDASTTKYRLNIAGTFGHLDMFLRVKSCTPLGCTRINSADNCCGSNLGFNLSFELSCRPAVFGMDAIKNIKFEKMDIDPMLVKLKTMGGALKLDAMDISPQVEKSVKSQVKDMLKTEVPWGGKPLNLEQILNKIVWYNAPSRAGTCL